jgi:hypothetical protein
MTYIYGAASPLRYYQSRQKTRPRAHICARHGIEKDGGRGGEEEENLGNPEKGKENKKRKRKQINVKKWNNRK